MMKHQELFIIVFMISIPVFLLKYKEIQQKIPIIMWICVTVHRLLSRKVFWHVYAKIPGHTGQNAITEGDLEYILIRLLFRRHFPKLMQTE